MPGIMRRMPIQFEQSSASNAAGQPILVSVQVGRPQNFEGSVCGSDKPWTSGIIKRVVTDTVMVRRTNLDGDQQADLVHHGGQDKAVLAYPQENYAFWHMEFPDVEWKNGCFGENLTLRGLTEADVCIGDVFSLGDCLLQISQPRQPCWKLSRRWDLPKLAVRVQQTRRTGWYLRVVQEGEIASGQTMSLVERNHPQWTITQCNEVMFARPRDADRDIKLASCEALSTSWKQSLSKRSSRSVSHDDDSEQKRLKGS